MIRCFLFASLFATILTPALARADAEIKQLYRGARPQAMGGAFVAIADDENALFYNPAGLAGISRYTFNYAAIDIDLSADTVATALAGGGNLLSGEMGPEVINNLMGEDTYSRVQFAPSFVMPNFGFALLVDAQVALYAKNPQFPDVTLGYQNTNGIIAGYGLSLNRRSKARSNDDIRLGIATKILWRRGGYRKVPVLSLASASANLLGDVAGIWGMGYGADLGFQYVRTMSKTLTLKSGIAWTDIGDVSFTGGQADPVKNNLSFGLAGAMVAGKAEITLAYDYRNMLNEVDWRKRNHIGAEIKLPVLSIYGGLNQAYLTYGVGFDAWLFRITALSYGEELDTYLTQHGSRRYMLRLALKAGF